MTLDILLNNTLLFMTITGCLLTGVFVAATALRDNSIMDIAYGPTFAVVGIALLYINARTDILLLILSGVVVLWAVRLGVRIGRKNIGRQEDSRYAAWRSAWQQRGTGYFLIRSYLQIYLLQGAIITIVGLPIILAISVPHELTPTWLAVGLLVALGGLAYESIADRQLDRFIAHTRAGDTDTPIMTDGLFRYSRRPNYFGETLFWWGLAIAVVPVSYGWLALASPLLITYIVTRITGPMLERGFLERYPDEYGAYMARTSFIVPLPPRRV